MNWRTKLATARNGFLRLPAVHKAALAGFLPKRLAGNVRMLAARRRHLPFIWVHGVPIASWPNLVLAYPEYDLLFLRRSAGRRDCDLAERPDAVFYGGHGSGSVLAYVNERAIPTFSILPSPIPWLPLVENQWAAGYILDSRGSWKSSRGRSEIDAFLDGSDVLKTSEISRVADVWLDRIRIAGEQEGTDTGHTVVVSPSPNRTNDVNSTRVRLEQIARDLNQPIQTVEPSLAEWTDLAALKVFRAGLTDNVANLVTNGAPEGFYALLCGIKVHVCEVATTYTMRGLTTDHDLPFRRGRPCDRNDLMAAVLTLSRFVVPKSGLIDPFELA